jgi:hypothetical protein
MLFLGPGPFVFLPLLPVPHEVKVFLFLSVFCLAMGLKQQSQLTME